MLKNIFSNKLLVNSFIVFIGAVVAGGGNYFYHFLMGRSLGPEKYGTLVSLISIVYIISVISLSLDNVVTKFTCSYKAKKKYGSIYSIFEQMTKKFFFIGLFLFLIFSFFDKQIAGFLKINDPGFLIIIVTSSFLTKFLVPVNSGILRGFLRFRFLSLNGILAVIIKLTLGFLLVKMGMSVLGAILGVVISDFLTYFVTFFPLRFLWSYRPKIVKVNWPKTISYSFPTLIMVLSLNSYYTTDIILVKHFLNPYEAGLYSALAMMGKFIFFISTSVISVMFPLVAEKFEKRENYKNILWQSLSLVFFICLLITLIYFFAPGLLIKFVYGSSFYEASKYLGFFGVFITLYSLNSVLSNFFLSIHKTIIVYFLFLAAIFQILMMIFFHNSLIQIIGVSTGTMALLFVILLLYYWQNEKK
jgi:O-antigen/teichoic acid export membrane protein